MGKELVVDKRTVQEKLAEIIEKHPLDDKQKNYLICLSEIFEQFGITDLMQIGIACRYYKNIALDPSDEELKGNTG